MVCRDVSLCQHVVLIREHAQKHTKLFSDFKQVRLILANLHGEFGLDRIAPSAGANKSESLEYFTALASSTIKFILRKPFDIAAVSVNNEIATIRERAPAQIC